MYKTTAAGYQGANWVQAALKPKEMSEFGCKVADMLGDLFEGIYHLHDDQLKAVDWGNNHHITFVLGQGCLSTYDSRLLTDLVLMAHQRAIRVQISPRSYRNLTLTFHPRKSGMEHEWHERHPTIDEAIANFNNLFPFE
jgi:hypothetical protein